VSYDRPGSAQAPRPDHSIDDCLIGNTLDLPAQGAIIGYNCVTAIEQGQDQIRPDRLASNLIVNDILLVSACSSSV
jgi:hypothetical protein